jgi:hypothetical protein
VVMYVIYICVCVVFSAGMVTMFEYVVSFRTNYGDECDFANDYTYAIYIWRAFSFDEERIGPTYCMASYIHIASRS